MRNQDDNEQNEQLMSANDNQPIESISSRSNMEPGKLIGFCKRSVLAKHYLNQSLILPSHFALIHNLFRLK